MTDTPELVPINRWLAVEAMIRIFTASGYTAERGVTPSLPIIVEDRFMLSPVNKRWAEIVPGTGANPVALQTASGTGVGAEALRDYLDREKAAKPG